MDALNCMDCDKPIADQNDHWADCEKAPEYVRYQAKADRRAKTGGPFAPGLIADRSQPIPTARHKCGCFIGGADIRRNHIDRGEPLPNEVECKGHRRG